MMRNGCADRVGIFRGHGENDAALAQVLCRTLDVEKRLALGESLPQTDAFDAVVADHATPERVVEIENEAFAREAAHRRQRARDVIGVKRHHPLRKRQLETVPVC